MSAQSQPQEGDAFGITLNAGDQFWGDTDQSRIESRLDDLEEMGVELIRIPGRADRFTNPSPMMLELERRNFRIKSGIGTSPNIPIKGHKGTVRTAHLGISPWGAGRFDRTRSAMNTWINAAQSRPLWNQIEYLWPNLGDAGEMKYPSGDEFWCYADNAIIHFREWFIDVYGPITVANAAWKTNYATWEEVTVPKPGQGTPEMWADLLVWYRDSKREYVEFVIQEMKARVGDKKIILYMPGGRYSAEDWDTAVNSLGVNAHASIRRMIDAEFLMHMAVKYDCYLQYTGANRTGNSGLSDRADYFGYTSAFFGENAGNQWAARNPVALIDGINQTSVTGIDYTWDTWLYGSGVADAGNDMVTRNVVYDRFVTSLDLLRGAQTNPDIQPVVPHQRPPFIQATGDLSEVVGHWAWAFTGQEEQRKGLTIEQRQNRFVAPAISSLGGELAWDLPHGGNVYVSLHDTGIGMNMTPEVSLFLRYYDSPSASGNITLYYSSTTERNELHPEVITLGGAVGWKTKRWDIDDAAFVGNAGGGDIRLAFNTDRIQVHSVGVYAGRNNRGEQVGYPIRASDADTRVGVSLGNVPGGKRIGHIHDGDYLVFEDFDFGAGASLVDAYIADTGPDTGREIEFRLGGVNGTLISTIDLENLSTGAWNRYTKTNSFPVSDVATGTHDLYVVFRKGSFNLTSFRFDDRQVLTTEDIGYTEVRDQLEYPKSGNYFLTGSGSDIWSSSDQCMFAFEEIADTQFTITARVEALFKGVDTPGEYPEYIKSEDQRVAALHAWSKAGVMIRDSLDPNSKNAFICITGREGVSFQRRVSTGGGSSFNRVRRGQDVTPGWVRLERNGSTFKSWFSFDGEVWERLGGDVTISMNGSVFVGMAVTSHRVNEPATAKFTNFKID